MSNDTALTATPEMFEMWTRPEIDLIRQTIAPGISLPELGLFAMVCKRTGLDPFTKQIYAIKRGGRMTIQTGIDGYRVLAVRTGELAGIDDAVYDDDDAEHPGRASVTVYRMVHGMRVAFTATARWNEYVQDNGSMWKRMPYLMLGKCAESLALRKAFPAELSGIYTAEEMAQADNDPQPRQTAPAVVEAAEAEPTQRAFVATPKPIAAVTTAPSDPIARVRASAEEQQQLVEALREAGHNTTGRVFTMLTAVLGRARVVNVTDLLAFESDLTVAEVAKLHAELTAVAGKRG